MTGGMSKTLCLLTTVATFSVGCGGLTSPKASIYKQLQSAKCEDRIAGIRLAGNRRDEKAIPLLVDRLEDDDPAVRLFAIEALRRITGQTLGYQYFADETGRREAVARWRHWREAEAGGLVVKTAHKGG